MPASPNDPLVDLTDDELVARAIRERESTRRGTQRQTEVATFLGTLLDLSERRTSLTLHTASGRNHHGELVAVARDHVRLRLTDGTVLLTRHDAVTAVRPDPAGHTADAQGDREATTDGGLLEHLADLVHERPDVAVVVRGTGDLLRGRLTAVGEDVVTIRLAGDDHPTFLPAAAIDSVLLHR